MVRYALRQHTLQNSIRFTVESEQDIYLTSAAANLATLPFFKATTTSKVEQ